MSLQDRLGSYDALQLLTIGTSLGLVTVSSRGGDKYNFSLMLFGIISHEMRSTTAPFRQFLILVIMTAIFDVFDLIRYPLSGFITLVSFLLLLLKLPIFFTCLTQLRERGGDLTLPGQANFGFQGLTTHREGERPNWSMPGGFAPGQNAPVAPNVPPSFPSSGGFRLGGEEENEGSGSPPPPGVGRGGYQNIA